MLHEYSFPFLQNPKLEILNFSLLFIKRSRICC
nr:MAG TPA: hypothetical protein [Caudoviricetes sp.]DAN82665.1 MAG TPA: hypothetical protein [Caudoviricetes sp.]